MIRAEEVVGAVLAALEREPRVKLHSHPIEVNFVDGIVTLKVPASLSILFGKGLPLK